MRLIISTARFAILAIGLSASATPALAVDDTWVSVTGTDSGSCAITAPCRTLGYALGQTTAGGTITILTSGRYAPVTITKSVHVMADGVEAVLTGIGACDAVVCIDAGPNDVISLRGITIQVPSPYQAGSSGLAFLNGAGLHLDKCTIAGQPTFGLLFYPSAAAYLHVFDSKLAGVHGAELGAGSGPLRAVFDRAEIHDGNHGIAFQAPGTGSIRGTVRNSLIANHHAYSIWLTGAAPKVVMVDRSVLANSLVGIENESGSSGTVRVGDTVFSGQRQDIATPNAVLSYGTNKAVLGVDGGGFGNTIPLK